MAVAKQRHDRSLVAAHSKLIGSMFNGDAIDIKAFIYRGQLGGFARMPFMPEVEMKVAEIEANGGKLIVPVEA